MFDKCFEKVSKEELKEITERYKNGDKSVEGMLITQHYGLIPTAIKRYAPPYLSVWYDEEELVNMGLFALTSAVKTFDFNKDIAFSTYAMSCLKNKYLHVFRKVSRRSELGGTVSLDALLVSEFNDAPVQMMERLCTDMDNVEKEVDFNEEYEFLQEAISELSEKEKDIVCRTFGVLGYEKEKQKDIKKRHNYSSCNAVIHIRKKALEKMKEKMLRDYGTSGILERCNSFNPNARVLL